MKYEPVYILFKDRVWKTIRFTVILGCIFVVFILVLPVSSKIYGLLTVLFFSTIQIVEGRKININYLKKLSINLEEKSIEIEVFKFDEFAFKNKFYFDSCDVKVGSVHNYKITSPYVIEFYEKKTKKLLFRQPSTGAWNLEIFVEIYELVKNAKGEKSFISSYKRVVEKGDF